MKWEMGLKSGKEHRDLLGIRIGVVVAVGVAVVVVVVVVLAVIVVVAAIYSTVTVLYIIKGLAL